MNETFMNVMAWFGIIALGLLILIMVYIIYRKIRGILATRFLMKTLYEQYGKKDDDD